MVHAQRIWDAGLTVTAGLLVAGRPDEVRACVEALIAHTTADVLALDLGDIDGAGAVLHSQAERNPDRVTVWHVADRPTWRGGGSLGGL